MVAVGRGGVLASDPMHWQHIPIPLAWQCIGPSLAKAASCGALCCEPCGQQPGVLQAQALTALVKVQRLDRTLLAAVIQILQLAGLDEPDQGPLKFARRYFVSTVGRDEAVIREYIKKQEKEDERLDQLSLWR
jgi:hypothetical protein